MSSSLSDYEVQRLARIAANKARLESLGVEKAAVSLAATTAARKPVPARRPSSKGGPRAPRATSDAPRRRSERVAGQPAPNYDERAARALGLVDAEASGGRDRRLLRENTVEEVYGAADVALLGQAEREWELFVDGYDSSGQRVYCQQRGETCHQCRQKTLGRHTSCNECSALSGVFCGDCLYMRYGEHVEEANANSAWVCPPCRGLCNCSFHRTRKGWAPTGTLYRRAIAEGFSSVAHYLVLTQLRGAEAVRAGLPLMPEEYRKEAEKELRALEEAGGDAPGPSEPTSREAGGDSPATEVAEGAIATPRGARDPREGELAARPEARGRAAGSPPAPARTPSPASSAVGAATPEPEGAAAAGATSHTASSRADSAADRAVLAKRGPSKKTPSRPAAKGPAGKRLAAKAVLEPSRPPTPPALVVTPAISKGRGTAPVATALGVRVTRTRSWAAAAAPAGKDAGEGAGPVAKGLVASVRKGLRSLVGSA